MEYVTQPLQQVTKIVVPVLKYPVVHLLISWLIILNVIDSLESIPMGVKKLILNPITKVLAVFLGLYYATQDGLASLVATVIVVIVYNLAIQFSESFDVINLTPDVMPGCVNVKVSDLVALYNGDHGKLKQHMYSVGVPVNMELTDLNAPHIASYLVNSGSVISQTCRAPGM